MAKEDIPDWSEIVALKSNKDFKTTAARLAEIESITAGLDKEAKRLKEEMAGILLQVKRKKVIFGDFRFVQTGGTHRYVSPELLMEQGVSKAKIEKATKKSSWVSTRLYPVNAPEGEEE